MKSGDKITFWRNGRQLEGVVREIFTRPQLIVADVEGKTHVVGYI